MRSIAILSALAEEQSGLLHLLSSRQSVRHAGRDFLVGDHAGRRVVLALSRIGKVAAATTACALVERFEVEQIVFTGVAGGLGAGVRVGDVVVADAFLQHDMDASPLFPRHEVPLYGQSRFATDPNLTSQLYRAAQSLGTGQACVHLGMIVSGDRFVATASESLMLQAALPEALAVEMEGAAVAQVCHDYSVPFAAVRAISDRADDSAHIDFARFVRDVASRYSDQIIGALLNSLPK